MADFDVDIDVASNTEKEHYATRAIIYNKETMKIQPHPSGYFFTHNAFTDEVTGMCGIDYRDMINVLKYNKVDLLTNSSYDYFSSKDDLLLYYHMEPDWECFLNRKFVERLPHIKEHFDLVSAVQPESIHDLADILALMRPGKQHLIDDYLNNKEKTRKNIFKIPKSGMYFKKSHAYGYAAMIIAVANKLWYDDPLREMGVES